MKRTISIFLLFLSITIVQGQSPFRDLMFSARLDTVQSQGTLVIPSAGNGNAGFSYHDDTLWFDITVNGLTGPITAAHIHQGKPGVEGPVVYSLVPYISGNKIKGSIPGISLINGDLKEFLEGNYYVNVHTAANPAGEIRGQIQLETDRNFRAGLDLAQAGNPGNNAFGLASINLGQDMMKLEFRVLVTGLSGPITNAQLRVGTPGLPGPVILTFMQFNSGNTLYGVYDLTTLPDPGTFLELLNQGTLYVNISTAMYPTGEIRGQVYRKNTLSFDTWMTTGQETGTIDPGTPENAMGLCSLSVSSTLDTIYAYALFDQLSGPVTAAHFHTGKIGQSGPVFIDLTPYLSGNRIVAVIVPSAPIDVAAPEVVQFLNDILVGNIYINAHTALNPDGEVRGQPDRLAREGVIYSLCAGQETGTVLGTKSAYGSGFVSLDRNKTNLHYGITGSMFSSDLTGAHFHMGLPGVNGPIIFPLPTDSVMEGYWNDATFTTDIANSFISGDIYNNFHTTLNPAGEIRGQVSGGNFCETSTGVPGSLVSREFNLIVYPNPGSSRVSFTYSLPQNSSVTIRMYNMLGALVDQANQGTQPSGEHTESFDISALPNGIYYYSVQVDSSVAKKGKIILSN
jgi:hypothetical protein